MSKIKSDNDVQIGIAAQIGIPVRVQVKTTSESLEDSRLMIEWHVTLLLVDLAGTVRPRVRPQNAHVLSWTDRIRHTGEVGEGVSEALSAVS